MFVTRSTGSFVVGGAVYFMFGSAINLVVFDISGHGGAGDLASEVAVHFLVVVHFVPECLWYFAEFVFDGHCPNPPLYFYKWGNSVYIHISLPLVLWWHWGLLLLGVLVLSSWGRFEVDVGGIGHSFPNSNKFPDIFLALGHGVPAWAGILLSSRGLLSDVPSCRGFAFSEFTGPLGAVMSGCMVVLQVLGMDSGLATTHTLYLFVGMSFLLLSVTFASFLTWGLVLSCSGLEWFDWGWNFGPNFPSNSR